MTAAAQPHPALLLACAWGLLQLLWQGALIAITLRLALALARKNSARLRYGLCCLALGGMVLCPVFTVACLEYGNPARSAGKSFLSVDAGHFGRAEQPPALDASVSLIRWTDSHQRALVLAWCIGALVCGARIFASVAAGQRLRSDSDDAVPETIELLASRIALRTGLLAPPRLVSSRRVSAPVVLGWWKPVIVLPAASLEGLTREQAEAVLAHELAHIQRGDTLVNLLQAGVEALFFYQPAVWWISHEVRREREHCCDDAALNAGGSVIEYAKALTVLEEQRFSSARIKLSLGMSGGDLSMRIQRLFQQREAVACSRATKFSLASVGVLTVAALAVVSIAASNRVSAQTAAPADAAKQHAASHRLPRPDLTCTFYEKGQPHPGVCEGSAQDANVFYCRQTDGAKLRQNQIGCQWKVEGLRAWERQKQQEGQGSQKPQAE